MKDSLKIFPVKKGRKDYIQFDFAGELTGTIASDGIKEWEAEIGKLPDGQKADLIFNCVDMNGFETEARRQWQETMKKLKPRIDDVWIVSENFFIRSAARTMGLLAGYQIKVCKSLEEVGK